MSRWAGFRCFKLTGATFPPAFADLGGRIFHMSRFLPDKTDGLARTYHRQKFRHKRSIPGGFTQEEWERPHNF